MTRVRWWTILTLFSIGVVFLDIFTGPHIYFPITLTISVCLAAWYLGRRAGIVFAAALVGCRFVIATTLEAGIIPYWAVALNTGIRMLVLCGIGMLVAQQRAMSKRVQVLEGILQICSFCKKIRRPDGTWEQIESYISKRSEAQFSHGFCEACGREHYGKYISVSNFQADESGLAHDNSGQ
jgi:hypothetical protein